MIFQYTKTVFYLSVYFVICALFLVSAGIGRGTGHADVTVTGVPGLDIPETTVAVPSKPVAVPVEFSANGTQISTLIFSVDFDENNLSFDPSDNNFDTIPDSIQFNVSPFVYALGVTYDPTDTDGELDFNISDISPPLSPLQDGPLVVITFTAGSPAVTTAAHVRFSSEPKASFGSTSGGSVPGTADGGVVLICPGLCDSDNDGVPDGEGTNPCTGGETENCDDNCPDVENTDQADMDNDSIGDVCDNCREVANADQYNSNFYEDDNLSLDGQQRYGNVCDPDFDNDGVVSIFDFNEWKKFNGQQVPPCPDFIDLNRDGFCFIQDFNVWRQYFGGPPGPGTED